MTVAEVAEALKLNQQTIRNWIDAQKLPAVRIGRRVRILRSDFERLIESSYTGGGPATGPKPERELEASAASFWDPPTSPVGPEPPGEAP